MCLITKLVKLARMQGFSKATVVRQTAHRLAWDMIRLLF